MKCQDNVVFKSVEERAGGSFTNDKGQAVNYDKAYVVRFDQENEKGVLSEHKAKFKGDNAQLFTKFKSLKAYDKINLIFEVSIQNSGCKLEVIDFSK